jgi:hypothetical protein
MPAGIWVRMSLVSRVRRLTSTMGIRGEARSLASLIAQAPTPLFYLAARGIRRSPASIQQSQPPHGGGGG